MPLSKSPSNPETGKHPTTAVYMNEKAQPRLAEVDDNHSKRPHSFWSTMSSFRYNMLLILVLASIAMCYVVTIPPHRDIDDTQRDPSEQSSFSALLSSVSDASLHEVLHKCASSKYKHGAYPEDRTAMQAVQKENAGLATSLIELAKRQTNSSVTSVVISTTTPVTTVTTTSTGSGTVSAGGNESTSASTNADTTSSGQSGATETGSTPSTTTNNSDTAAKTDVTTSTPGPKTAAGDGSSFVSFQVIYTTTLPNGVRSTITRTTVVVAGERGTAATATGATGTPALQNAGKVNTFSLLGLLVPGLVAVLIV